MNTITQIEAQMAHIEAIREQMFDTTLIQLHPNIKGFQSPETYGVYKETGGKALGVVGGTEMLKYEPPKLKLLLDVVTKSLIECCPEVDLTKLEFKQWKEGAKCGLFLPLKEIKIKSPMKGDITKVNLSIKTGFDGNTAYEMGIEYYRIWCSNGCGAWDKSQMVKFKNTILNASKVPMLASQIIQTIDTTNDFVAKMNELVKTTITKTQVQKFLLDNFGYDMAKVDDMNKKSRDRMNAINEAVGIEMANTGENLYSLFNGITRFVTHVRAKDETDRLFNPSITTQAQRLLSNVVAMTN